MTTTVADATGEILAAHAKLAAHVAAHDLRLDRVGYQPGQATGTRGDGPDRPRRPILPSVYVSAWRRPADWLAWVESLPAEVVHVQRRRGIDTVLSVAVDHNGLCWHVTGGLPWEQPGRDRVHAAVDWYPTRAGRCSDEGWAPALAVLVAARCILGETR